MLCELLAAKSQCVVPLDMKGCMCHFAKWQMHPFISKGTTCIIGSWVKWPLRGVCGLMRLLIDTFGGPENQFSQWISTVDLRPHRLTGSLPPVV